MQYLGGKTRLAPKILPVILDRAKGRDFYVEPFVGGGSMFAAVAPHFPNSIAADTHPDLIAMWREVAAGWVPPASITEEEYRDLRHAPTSALRAFAGFGVSFGGKWFGGYARNASGTDYCGQAVRAIEKKRSAFAGAAHIINCDYAALTPLMGPRVVTYCDPPYAGTTGYSTGDWDAEAWWSTANEWRERGALVLVSEFAAPTGWEVVWSHERTVAAGLHGAGDRPVRTEILVA